MTKQDFTQDVQESLDSFKKEVFPTIVDEMTKMILKAYEEGFFAGIKTFIKNN